VTRVMIDTTKQARLTTTGVVAFGRAYSGVDAFLPAGVREFSHPSAIGTADLMNDGTELTRDFGTRAWSPPV